MRPDFDPASGKSYDPALRGYTIHYHSGEANHCPGCGRSQWIVGRIMAECIYCETALPLDHASHQGLMAPIIHRQRPEIGSSRLPVP